MAINQWNQYNMGVHRAMTNLFLKENCNQKETLDLRNPVTLKITTFKVGTVLFKVNMAAQFGFLIG